MSDENKNSQKGKVELPSDEEPEVDYGTKVKEEGQPTYSEGKLYPSQTSKPEPTSTDGNESPETKTPAAQGTSPTPQSGVPQPSDLPSAQNRGDGNLKPSDTLGGGAPITQGQPGGGPNLAEKPGEQNRQEQNSKKPDETEEKEKRDEDDKKKKEEDKQKEQEEEKEKAPNKLKEEGEEGKPAEPAEPTEEGAGKEVGEPGETAGETAGETGGEAGAEGAGEAGVGGTGEAAVGAPGTGIADAGAGAASETPEDVIIGAAAAGAPEEAVAGGATAGGAASAATAGVGAAGGVIGGAIGGGIGSAAGGAVGGEPGSDVGGVTGGIAGGAVGGLAAGSAAKGLFGAGTAAGGAGAAGAGAGAAAGGAAAAAGGAVAAEGAAVGTATGVAIGWPVILIGIVIILIILLIVYLIGIFLPRTHTDIANTADKAVIDEVSSLANSGKISFVQADDLGKIQKGNIGKPSLQAMAYLAKKHESVQINYNNQNYDNSVTPATSTVTSSAANEPFEFDIAAVDSIKCVDTTSTPANRLAPIPVSLNSNFDWGSLIKPEYTDKIKCAVGYYPGDTPVKGVFADTFGPGEFLIWDIASAGKKAAQEKAAEITSEMLDIDSAGIADKGESLIPVRINIDSRFALKSIKDNSPGIIGNLAEKIKATYPNTNASDGVVSADSLPYGVHISYL